MEIGGDHGGETAESAVQPLLAYLGCACPPLLSLRDAQESDFRSVLGTQDVAQLLVRFASDAQPCALYVEMGPAGALGLPPAPRQGDQGDGKASFVAAGGFRFSLEMRHSPGHAGVAVIKKTANPLEGDRPFRQQLQVVSFPGTADGSDEGSAEAASADGPQNPMFSVLQLYTKLFFGPAVQSYVESGKMDDKTEAGVLHLQKKIRELELALVQCQKRLDIPPIHLNPHPDVAAAAQRVRPGGRIDLEELGLASKLQDDQFLNQLQAITNQWVKDIQKVTRLTSTPFPETAAEEVEFWRSLEAALRGAQEELQSPNVLITVTLLKSAKRFLATIALENNTGLGNALTLVLDVNTFLRDFPIAPLVGASSLQQIEDALTAVFNHFGKLRNVGRSYDLERVAKLLETVGKTFNTQLLAALRRFALLKMSHKEFQAVVVSAERVFKTWDGGYETFRNFFKVTYNKRHRDPGKPDRNYAEVLHGLQLEHVHVQSRMKELAAFRDQHDRFRTVVGTTLADEDTTTLAELEDAYAIMMAIDVLAVTPEGNQAWTAAREAYDARVDRCEERIAGLLCSRLKDARTADDMFRIFGKFNPLFVRPRVRMAITQFQMDLMKSVRDAVAGLQAKFTNKYESSEAKTLAALRDIPPLAGKILWARQIEKQLQLLMHRTEDVLGPGWEQHAEGRQLKETCDQLLYNVDTQRVFHEWLDDWRGNIGTKDQQDAAMTLLLTVTQDRMGRPQLQVNFDEKTVTLFKELRSLQWLKFSIPDKQNTQTAWAAMKALADTAAQRYPSAMALKATLRTYAQTRASITPEGELLLVPHLQAIRDLVNRAFPPPKVPKGGQAGPGVTWKSVDLGRWVVKFNEEVFKLQQKTEELGGLQAEVAQQLQLLKKCLYEKESMSAVVGRLQELVDAMLLKGLSNMPHWVRTLDQQVEDILVERLQWALAAWVQAFGAHSAAGGDGSRGKEGPGTEAETELPGLQIDCTVHEVLLHNQVLYLSPPLEYARAMWVRQFHQYLGVVAQLPRLRSESFAVLGREKQDVSSLTFTGVLQKLPRGALSTAYQQIETQLAQVQEYAQGWLQYQSLWDMSSQTVMQRLGENVELWGQLLQEAKSARAVIESGDTEKSFGPVIIDYSQVQSKVNLKYDAWQKELQLQFGSILADAMRSLHSKLVAAKGRLEATTVEGPTKDVIQHVTYIQEMRRSNKALEQQAMQLEFGEKLLTRQRYQFPADWPQASLVSGAYQDFQQILQRRTLAMEESVPLLQSKIQAEDKAAAKRISELVTEWAASRPLAGDHSPSDALAQIAAFEVNVGRARQDFDRLSAAKDALALEPTGEDLLAPVEQELAELREVWQSLQGVWEGINELRESLWSAVVLRKVRRSLEALQERLRGLPNRVRQYQAYNHVQETLKGFLGAQPLLNELKTDALKERHWKGILKRLGVRGGLSELTLGGLWAVDLTAHKKDIQDTVSAAQGEMALEEFLRQVREHWQSAELELVSYQMRVRLIKGWDVLFSKLEDHLNALSSMKQSPYFRAVQEFQEEGALWEDRLTKLQAIFDAWTDVQRRWVYLEGIFFGSADIKAQLPSEFSRFKSVDAEFVQLMRRVSHKPQVLEVLSVENLLRQLERQETLMSKIQKALGDALERQRAAFSRFYFVGDEDLLEIIGNADEPGKVTQHLSKMFASLCNVTTESDEATQKVARATAMLSKDGERVGFLKPVTILEQGVKEWLGGLEVEMRATLASMLAQAVKESASFDPKDGPAFVAWCSNFPAQAVVLAAQIAWSASVDKALAGRGAGGLAACVQGLNDRLRLMAESVLSEVPPQLRKKYEQLITELVHQRNVTRQLAEDGVGSPKDFKWLYHLRFYFNPAEADPLRRLGISMADASFFYGFEYLGIGERLVQTPLTDRCYLTLTQALHFRMGGNPFGPAGTGKTESVKALGAQLGRFVLVFNCDETFDYGAMGRLFAGLCQVGAWGCFDEFNRLEERILSAVSQQILTIQRGLSQQQGTIGFLGRNIVLHPNVGIFVTMNPGYAGRSNLPDNLKQLFRAVAMVVPDRRLIAQVMLFSQGISHAEELAGKIVLLFQLCEEQLSTQTHYDFGLRALKSVLVGAGGLKRDMLAAGTGDLDLAEVEREVLVRSACNTAVPKLVSADYVLFAGLLAGVFPGCEVSQISEEVLREKVQQVCLEQRLVMGEAWVNKVLQLKKVLALRHGVMMVGPSGSGKSSAWRTLLAALELADGVKGDAHVLDPKALSKEALYGVLDPTTLEWTDGVFTKVLREVLTNRRGGISRRHWIIFDGEVDPEWAENLNSVLDDNKILTLPSGERLEVPSNVRIMLEVDSLQYATLATVSRCGMVWFSGSEYTGGGPSGAPVAGALTGARKVGKREEGTVTLDMLLRHKVARLKEDPVSPVEGLAGGAGLVTPESGGGAAAVQREFVTALEPLFVRAEGAGPTRMGPQQDPLVQAALLFALSSPHVMDATRERLVETMCSLLQRGIALVLEYNETHPDFPMSPDHMERFGLKWLLHSLLWGFGGSMNHQGRVQLAEHILENTTLAAPDGISLVDLQVRVEDGEWMPWSASVPRVEIESHKVVASDVVVTTTDTVRHVEVLKAWLASHRPLILCGPPGSGKTMTLTSTLQAMPHLVLASLNFSSSTTPALLLKTFKQYCETVRTPHGMVLQPSPALGVDKWLVVFCDEINLPAQDAYGTQRVITFLRQLTEQGGFWREDCTWVSLRRIQFVGACNPPTDAGRVALSPRFLRHAPLLLVDFPATESLGQIYGAFNSALLKLHPALRGHLGNLTDAMVDFYEQNQRRFTADQQPQYIYSPRELSRWVRALYEAISPLDALDLEGLVRLWAHEASRLFHDRLVTQGERDWCNAKVDEVALRHFSGVSPTALDRPMLYSSWLTKHYASVGRAELKDFIAARLKVFYEEELDIPLVIFDDVLEHVLRIDRVLRQPMGHLLLVGESGAGKTVLSKFVSWMNGLSIFQIKANSRYTLDQFDEDIRSVMKRVGCNGERVCFIFDESNVLSAAFLERMNALLASGEVPGLFEGDEYTALMAGCRDAAQRTGVMIDSEDELFRRFTREVQRNLHVIFTMNPASADFSDRCMTSPALFNRCVVDWFGTWSHRALAQVGFEFTAHVDTGDALYAETRQAAELLQGVRGIVDEEDAPLTLRHALVCALVCVHKSVKAATEALAKRSPTRHFISPRDYLDLIKTFVRVVGEKRSQLEEQQLHINVGLDKLKQTQASVSELQKGLTAKEAHLKDKNQQANAKLQQMVAQQNEAERRKEEAEKLNTELEQQRKHIATRRGEAERDLSQAEPALLDAQASVRSIKKPMLDEIRALARPPAAVRSVMEAVAIMLGHSQPEWADVRKVIAKADFISTVVNFDTDNLSVQTIRTVEEVFASAGNLDFETVNRASKACGPLYQWINSQINFSRIALRVQPLRDEVAKLQAASDGLEGRKDNIMQQIKTLESSIARYKEEYAEAIREIESVKGEMEVVKQKVGRAEALLGNLGQEKGRWELSSRNFQAQMETLVGDCLLSAAFITYVGIFDYRSRKALMDQWKRLLDQLGVPFREELSLIDYLSRAADRLSWQGQGLPSDELCVENAIVLERFNRFPLVVDPSGQATKFLLEKYKERKMACTSFLDAAFMKTLASAIRFGTPLLVQDVETIDPILNPVLNKELQKFGGRTLIRLGSEDIDFSPKFLIILTTRNPSAQFTPDLCSRVTMVNFTVTPASLHSQALSSILKAERPDVDRRRTQILQLQGEQSVKLRQLEDRLLDTISNAQGSILDDDTVIKALEDLKREAGDVAKEVEKTKEVMAEVNAISDLYEPLALACSRVYFAMEKMGEVHFLYQFSLQFFLEILAHVLATGAQNKTATDASERILLLKQLLFRTLAKRVTRALLHEDKQVFGMRLAQIFLQGDAIREPLDMEVEMLLRGASGAGAARANLPKLAIPGRALSERQEREASALAALPSFSKLGDSLLKDSEGWITFLEGQDQPMPEGWLEGGGGSSERAAWLRLLLTNALRPDRTLLAMDHYIAAVFGADFGWNDTLDLAEVVFQESKAASPVLLCSEPGHDASYKVDALADSTKRAMSSVAMGSSNGFEVAEKSVAQACKEGTWVLLKNIHLCPDWLKVLEKRLHGLSAHPDFRLFLTSEVHPKLPTSLLRVSRVLVVEAPSGVRANVLRFLTGIPPEKMDRPPVERNRLYVLLAWFHAIVLERLRYTPIGWSKRYEFSEADSSCALGAIDNWVQSVAANRSHVSPEDIPWEALRTLLSQSIYGGRLDNDFDQQLMESFVDQLFVPGAFDVDFALSSELDASGGSRALVKIPDVTSRQGFLDWAEALPPNNPPTWLGLAPNAETAVLITRGASVLSNLLHIQDSPDEASLSLAIEEDMGTAGSAVSAQKAGGKPPGKEAKGAQHARLEGLLQTVTGWLSSLPADLRAEGLGSEEDSADALHRCLCREVAFGKALLERVRSDLDMVKDFCQGTMRATNEVRALVGSLLKDTPPAPWVRGFVCPPMPAGAWVEDIRQRLAHLTELAAGKEGAHAKRYWLGGLFNPDAFVTATRQYVAQMTGCSLEELSLKFNVGGAASGNNDSSIFAIRGLSLEGASWDSSMGELQFSDEHKMSLPLSDFKWVRAPAAAETGRDRAQATPLKESGTSSSGGHKGTMMLPLYLHAGRTHLIVQVELKCPSEVPQIVWRQRGVALIAWTQPV